MHNLIHLGGVALGIIFGFNLAQAGEFQAKFRGGESVKIVASTPVIGADPDGPLFIEKAELSLSGLEKGAPVHWVFRSCCLAKDSGNERSSHSITGDAMSDSTGELHTSLTHAGRFHVISFLAGTLCKQSLKVKVNGHELLNLTGTDLIEMNL